MASVGRFNLATGLQDAILENAYDQISILEAQLKREKILRQYADNPAISESALQSFEEASWEGVKTAVKTGANTVVQKIKQWANAFVAWVKKMFAHLKLLYRKAKNSIANAVGRKNEAEVCKADFISKMVGFTHEFPGYLDKILAGETPESAKIEAYKTIFEGHENSLEKVELTNALIETLSRNVDTIEKASTELSGKTVKATLKVGALGDGNLRLRSNILGYLATFQKAAKFFAATTAKALSSISVLGNGSKKSEEAKSGNEEAKSAESGNEEAKTESTILFNAMLPDMIYREFMTSDSRFETDEYGFVEEVA